MKLALVVLVLLAPLTAFAPMGAAAPCDFAARQTLSTSQGIFYVEVRAHSEVAYVYKESNGIGGLQRGAAQPVTSVPDDCVDAPDVTPDNRLG